METQLLQDVRDVKLHRAMALAGRLRDLRVLLSAQQRNEQVALAIGQVADTRDRICTTIDVERAQFAENTVRYEAQLMFMSSQIKAMLSAIQG